MSPIPARSPRGGSGTTRHITPRSAPRSAGCATGIGTVVLFDAHSIRSVVPRLFEGTLPVFNLGTNSGRSCAAELAHSLQEICNSSGLPTVVDGRFKGGYITRHYGQPDSGVHAVQLELAMRGYLDEPAADLREHTGLRRTRQPARPGS